MKAKKYIIFWIAILFVHAIVWLSVSNSTIIGGDAFFSYGLSNETEGFLFWDLNQIEAHTDETGWIKGEDVYSYLTVDENEAFDYSAVWNNQQKDVHPPLYYALLHTVCSIFTGKYSKWFGLIINIMIAILVDIIIYKIVLEIGLRQKSALFITFFYGLLPGNLQLVSYVRMYELLSLWCIVLIWLHLKLLHKKGKYTYIMLAVTLVCGGLTHYFFWVFAGICFCGYMLHLYIQGELRTLSVKYVTYMVSGGLISVLIFPYSIYHMFFSSKGDGILGTLFSFQFYGKEYMILLDDSVFCGQIGWFLIIFLIFLIWNVFLGKENWENINRKEYAPLFVFLCGAVYALFIMKTSSTVTWYYLSPCFTALCIGAYAMFSILFENVLSTAERKVRIIASALICIGITFFVTRGAYSYAQSNVGYAEAMKAYYQPILQEEKKDVIFLYHSWNNLFGGKLDFVAYADEIYVADIQEVENTDWQQCIQNRQSADDILVLIQRSEDYESDFERIQQYLPVKLELYQASGVMLYEATKK